MEITFGLNNEAEFQHVFANAAVGERLVMLKAYSR